MSKLIRHKIYKVPLSKNDRFELLNKIGEKLFKRKYYCCPSFSYHGIKDHDWGPDLDHCHFNGILPHELFKTGTWTPFPDRDEKEPFDDWSDRCLLHLAYGASVI